MPRKLHKFGESASTPERPGSGEPRSAKERALARMAETKANVVAGRAHAKAEMLRRREEPQVSMTEMSDDESQALSHELETQFETAADEIVEAEARLQTEPSIENAKDLERKREVAQELFVASEEALPEGRSRRKSKATVEKESVDTLEAEKENLKTRMQEMGGVWGGESYFIMSDRVEEIDREIAKVQGRPGAKRMVEALLPPTEESFVAGEPTTAERMMDARKTLKQMKRYEHDIEARQKNVQKELARYGIRTPAQIDAELAQLSPELRESSAGANPGLWFKLRKMARGLAGMERPPEVKVLLSKYVDLENEMNGELHKRREAELELESAEAAAGKTRVRLKVPLASVVEQPVYQVQQELAAVRALKMIEEEMQDDMMNFAGRKDEFTTEDLELYTEKLDSLNKRLQALDEGAGDSKAAAKTAREAKEIYVKYRRQLSQAASGIVGQAQTAGPGEARPPSVIGQRTKAGGQFTPAETRTTVQLSKMETADKKERREWEKAGEKERVNRDVQMYRSIKWRKELIDSINSDEAVRSAMHSIYEAYKKRVQDMMARGELNLITGSPDPALDYTLDLYRLHARKANGKHLYDEKICQTALEEINRVDELLGGQWDTDRTTDRLVSALLREKPNVVVDKQYLAEVAAANDNAEETELEESDLEEVVPIALTAVKPSNETVEPIPLVHEKRSRSDEELEAIEEADALISVPPVLVEPVIEQEEVPLAQPKPVAKREVSPEKKSKRKAKEAAKRQRQAAVVMEGGGTIVDLGARRKEDRKARRDAIKAKQTGGKSEESA